MGCSCRKSNLNESIYEIAEQISDYEYRRTNIKNKDSHHDIQNIKSGNQFGSSQNNLNLIHEREELNNDDITSNNNNTSAISILNETEIEKFDKELSSLINKLRKNKFDYKSEISKYKKFIISSDNSHSKYYLSIPENLVKIPLMNGKEQFDASIYLLSKYFSELEKSNQTLKSLKYSKPLELEVFIENLDNIKKLFIVTNEGSLKEFITNVYIDNYKRLIKEGICITGFHYDLNPCIADLSLILQLIDDNNSKGQRRNNILNPESTLIGIKSIPINKRMICTFIVFGKYVDDYEEELNRKKSCTNASDFNY